MGNGKWEMGNGNGHTLHIEYRALAHRLSDKNQLFCHPSSLFGDANFKPIVLQCIQVLHRH